MSERNLIGHVYAAHKRPHLHMTAILALAAVVAVALFLGGVTQAHSVAYADANVLPKGFVVDGETQGRTANAEIRSDDHSSSSNSSDATAKHADSGESASTADASESQKESREGVQGIEILILAGIVLVAVFFVGWIVRLNANMRKMNDSMHSK